jgi:hypothetical protein
MTIHIKVVNPKKWNSIVKLNMEVKIHFPPNLSRTFSSKKGLEAVRNERNQDIARIEYIDAENEIIIITVKVKQSS